MMMNVMWRFMFSFLCACLVTVNAQWPTNMIPRLIFYARPPVVPLEPSILMHNLRYIPWTFFEVWTTCNDTAVGPLFLGTLRRTNQAVNCTLLNKNTALAYASYRVMSENLPEYKSQWDAMMAEFGLDPSNTSNDTSTPIGLGNKIGYAVRDFMVSDGMNSLGDLTANNMSGTLYGLRYSDYTNYLPVNSAFDFSDPDRWQPLMENRIGANLPFGNGTFLYGVSGVQSIQHYVTPFMRYVKAFSFKKPNKFMKNFTSVFAKYNTNNATRKAAYLQQAADIVSHSASLTDQDKIEAEFFESKNLAFGTPLPFLAANTRGTISGQQPWTVDDWSCWEFLVNAAVWDAVILAWSVKRKRDTVRPISAVRFLYKNQNINAWGGPGKGTVTMKGEAWKPWLRTMPHSEFPSASTCMCTAWAEANRQWFGNDDFKNFTFPVTKGTSSVEPGVVPAVNMTVGPFPTFTLYAQKCGHSRHSAGVHFQQSIDDAYVNCRILGQTAGDLWRQYLAGTITQPVDPNDRPHWTGNENDDEDLSVFESDD